MTKRQRITKSDTSGEKVKELTNLEVQEVSIVDRPANRREFLVTKRAGGRSMRPASAAEVAAESVTKTDEPVTAPAINAEDPAAVIAPAAKADEPAPVIAPATKADEPATKADEPAPAAAAKAEAAATPVDTSPPAPATPEAVVDKIKAQVVAGIEAIVQRLDKFRSDVDTSPVYSDGVPSAVFDHIWYLRCMLDEFYNVGGPQWEMATAFGDAEITKSVEAAKKGHKAITGARVVKLRAVFKALGYAHGDLDSLLKELDTEIAAATAAVAATGDPSLSFAKSDTTEPVVAPATTVAPAPVASPAPAALSAEDAGRIAKLEGDLAKALETINKSNDTITSLQTKLDSVAEVRQDSRQLSLDPAASNHGNLIWPADLAAVPVVRKGRQF